MNEKGTSIWKATDKNAKWTSGRTQEERGTNVGYGNNNWNKKFVWIGSVMKFGLEQGTLLLSFGYSLPVPKTKQISKLSNSCNSHIIVKNLYLWIVHIMHLTSYLIQFRLIQAMLRKHVLQESVFIKQSQYIQHLLTHMLTAKKISYFLWDKPDLRVYLLFIK